MGPLVENNRINLMNWFTLIGPDASKFNADFSSRIDGEDKIPSYFRGHNPENTMTKVFLEGKSLQVGILNFYKGGAFQKQKGIVGYLNDSIGQGYGPGTHFLKVVKGLIEGYCRERGMEAVVEKEGVNLIVEVSGGELPENFSEELGGLIYKNRDKFNFTSRNKTINVLDILGKNNIKIKFGYTDVPAESNIFVGQIKEAVRQLYENVKFNGQTGKAELADLLKTAQTRGVKLPVKVIFEALDQPSVLKDYFKHRDIFEKSLTTLPDEYIEVLNLALKKSEISRSTYDYCKMVSTRFIDVKYGCLNESGVHLTMERALKHPEKARSVIGITGADELSGQIVMRNGRAYNFSLDINNLGGINREFGVEAGDQFIEAHIKAFDEARQLVNKGKITDVEDVFVEYFRIINSKTINVKTTINNEEKTVEAEIGGLERVYAKNKRMVHKGATATVVVTGINVNEKRGIKRTEEFLRDEVKNLKSGEGKDGSLLIEIREYGGTYYLSALVKVNGDTKEVQTKYVERMIKQPVKANVPEHVQGGASILLAGLITYPVKLVARGKLNEFRLGQWGKEGFNTGWSWSIFGGKTMLLEKYTGFTAKDAMFAVMTADQLTGLALAPDGQKGRQAFVGGTSVASFFGGMKAGGKIASKVPAPALIKMTIPLITGIVASQIGESGTTAFIDRNWLWMKDLTGSPVMEGAGRLLSPFGMATPGYWWQKEIEPRWQPESTLGKGVKSGTEAAVDVGGTVAELKLAKAVLNFATKKLPGLAGRTLMRIGGIPLFALWLAEHEMMLQNQQASPGMI